MKKKFFKLFIIILLIIILATFSIRILNKNIMPIYMNYAEGEIKRLITTVINKSITNDITDDFNVSDLFITNTDLNTKTVIVDFDPVILNRSMARISDLVYDNLKLISEKDSDTLKKYNVSDSIFYIPTGVIFKNSVLLNNLGPKIPVKMEIISSVNPNIETKVSEYGINNSLVEVFIHVIVSVRMILPTMSKEMEIVVVVPLAVKLIQGNIPENYLNTK